MEKCGEEKGEGKGGYDGWVTRLDVARGRTDDLVCKDCEGKEDGKPLPYGSHGGTDEKDHESGGEDIAEEETKEEGFGVALVDFRGGACGLGGAGADGRGACDDEEEGIQGHDDAHGGELEEDADGGGHAEDEWTAVAGSFEEGDQPDDANGGEEHGEEGFVGWVDEGVKEDGHAAEDFVGAGNIGVCEAIWMRGEVGVAYGIYFEL